MRFRCVCVEMSSASRVFQVSRTSAEGAQPRTKIVENGISLGFSGESRCKGSMLTARVDQARESHTRDVAGAAEDAFKVPDSFCAICASVYNSFLFSCLPRNIIFLLRTYGSG